MSWVSQVLVVLAVAVLWVGVWWWLTDTDMCPECGRELDPLNYHGWRRGSRRFCHWCRWDEDKQS